MSSIKRFEEVRAWQKARELVNSVYEITGSGKFSKDFGLRDQIRRATGSVMHNIAEGFDSGSDPEFRRFLRISSRSVSEVQSQLYTALDQGYITKEQFETLYEQAETAKAFIRKFILYLSKLKPNGVHEEPASYDVTREDELTDDVGRGTWDENDN